MNDPRPSFPLYPADFWGADAVALMDFEAVGLFMFLLCREWQEGSLTTDERVLQRVVGARVREWEPCWAQVRGCFYEQGGRLYNKRLEEERAVADGFSAKQSTRAKARWERFKAGQDATAMPRHSHGNATAMPRTGQDGTVMDGTGQEVTAPERKRPRRASRAEVEPKLPDVLDTPEFRAAWTDWLAYRSELGLKPWVARTVQSNFDEWAGWGAARAVEAIRFTMRKQYQGIVEPQRNGHRPSEPTGLAAVEEFERRLNERERTVDVKGSSRASP